MNWRRMFRNTLAAFAVMFAAAGAMGTLKVQAAGLEDVFVAGYYAGRYADLKDAFGEDEKALYQHYLTYGLSEGREMSPVIDVVKYRKAYGDLDAAFGDDWGAYVDHYFRYGAAEGRKAGISFDPVAYAEAYPDVKAAYGDDYEAITKHYLTYGIKEGRTAGNVENVVKESKATGSTKKQQSQQPQKPQEPQEPDSDVPESSGGDSEQPQEPDSDVPGSSDAGEAAKVDKGFINYLNEQRVAAGLQPLEWMSDYEDVAKQRAVAIVKDFSHNGKPDGCGENILMHYKGDIESHYEAWYNSDGHRKNMFNERYTQAVYAVYYFAGDYYAVTLFK